MDKTLLTTFLATMLPAVASAGSMTASGPATPQVSDWSGFYAGAAFAGHDGESLEFKNPSSFGPYEFKGDDGVGLFAGYAWQSGSIVYGGELAWYDIGDQTVVGFPTAHMDDMWDASGRLGYAFDNFQIYALAGYSRSKYRETAASWDVDGHHFGIGVEYMIGEHFTVGAQYVDRQLTGSNSNGSGQKAEIDHSTLSVRGAYRF